MNNSFRLLLLVKLQVLAFSVPLGAGSIQLSESFGIGAAMAFERAILPDTDTVILSSTGGLMIEGIAIGRIIRERRLGTVVPEGASCFSACAEAFLGGISMRIDGVVAFHQPRLPTALSSQRAFDQGFAGGTLMTIYRFEMGFGFELTRQINKWTNANRLLSFDNTQALLSYKSENATLRLPRFFQY